MEFIDREDELRLLGDHLDRPGPALFVLFGRRRIGKTALLQRAIASHPRAAYHVGTRSTIHEELARLSRTLARAWGHRLLEAQPLTSIDGLIAYLEGLTGPHVLALDELPYLVESDPSLPGQLQAAWDRSLSASELKLIVCGSAVSVMSDTFLSHRSPLFGRRTGQLRLGPLEPHHLVETFRWPTPNVVELAALFGGVPGYLQRLDPGDGLVENLVRAVLRKGEPLYEEVPFLLREELREPRVYQAILAVIAGGARKFGEISSKTGLERANLSRYLSILQDLGLVEREVPVTERHPEKSRKGLYRIADPFLATWYRFVHPHRDRLERGLMEEVVEQEIAPQLHHVLSLAVEPVVRELFLSAPLAAQVPFEPAHIGRHWSPTAEVDVVLLDEGRSQAFVGEVKWSSDVPVSTLDNLRRRVGAEPAFAGMQCTYALISRSGFSGPPRRLEPDERLVDLERVELR